MLRAIRAGEVDALVVEGDSGPRLFTLQGLDAEQNRLRGEMLAQVSDAVIAVDLADRVTFLNAAAERQYRVSAADVLGRDISEICTLVWPDPDAEAAMRTALHERGEWRGELKQRTHDGREIHVETTVTALRGPGAASTGVVHAVRDITGRVRAEARTRLLGDAAAVLLSTQDPDAMLTGVFATIAPTFGLDAYFNFMVDGTGQTLRLASYAGVSASDAQSITPLAFGTAVCGRVATTHQPIHACDIQQSNDPMTALVKAFGLRVYACYPLGSGGQLLGTLSFASRVRDRFDESELHILETISQYVTAAYERLRLMTELREADRRKDDFLATLAHELRNPLAPIRTAAGVLRRRAESDPMLRKCRDIIDRQVSHMTRLLEDLLDVARLTRGALTLQRQPRRLRDVVDVAVEMTRPVMDDRGHTLAVADIDPTLVLDADETRLAQILANLLHNAAKYTGRGGRIAVDVTRAAGTVVVRVSDNGIGVDPALQQRIFDPFTQVATDRDHGDGGLGIGLGLTRRLVEMHGGTIAVESAGVGQGATFIVSLPLGVRAVDGHTSPGADAAGQEDSTGTAVRWRVLVVDDNVDAADTAAMLLEPTCDVRTVYDGDSALHEARRFHPHLVLLDLGMPGLNGQAVCQELRRESWGPQVVIAAVTGWGQDEDQRRTRLAGFDHHLVKPVDPDTLLQLVRDLSRPPLSVVADAAKLGPV